MKRLSVLTLVAVMLLVPTVAAVAAGHVEVEVVTTFGVGENPEGVAVDKEGNVFVTQAFTGELLKFAPGSSDYEVFGTIDGWLGGGQFGAGFLGLAVDAKGNVYGAAEWFGSTGVYKFDRETGEASRIPGTDSINFPNSLAFDKRGNLYVTDTYSNPIDHMSGADALGAVWRIRRDGVVEKWIEDPSLGGNGLAGLPTPIGANGIAYRQGTLYVANTEGASILTIPVQNDGQPGDISVHTTFDVSQFEVPDGIALDVHGAIYVAVIPQNAIKRVNTDGSIELLAIGGDLDFPSSVAFGTGKGMKQTLYAVNLAIGPPGPGPALLSMGVGEPGMPLP